MKFYTFTILSAILLALAVRSKRKLVYFSYKKNLGSKKITLFQVNFSRAEFEMSKPELKNIAEQVCSEQDVPKGMIISSNKKWTTNNFFSNHYAFFLDKCKESFEDVAKNTEKCLSYEFYKKLKAVDGVSKFL